jgi:hypothetical protein
VKVGETVQISYVDQAREGLDPTKTLWEVVSDGLDYIQVGKVEIPSRAYVSQFGFKGPDQQKPAGVLSGGERNRLNLALTLKQGGNLLLLDEPTNDLDVETSARWRTPCWSSPAAPSSSATTGGSSTGSRRTSSPTRAPTRSPEVVLVRGQLRGLREEQGRASRRGGGPPPPGHLPEADPRLSVRAQPWHTG